MRVVLDTNVWVSGLEFGGKPRLALDRALRVDQLAISDFIEAEVLRVLTSKFGRDLRARFKQFWTNYCSLPTGLRLVAPSPESAATQ